MNTISLIRQMPSTKKEIESFFLQTKNSILNGNYNILEIAVMLKGMEDIIKKLRTDTDIDNLILDEVSKDGKEASYGGAKLQIRETGVKYDYEVCNDAIYDELKTEIANKAILLKEREDILKAHKSEWVNAETGEIIYPPNKLGKEKIIITLSK